MSLLQNGLNIANEINRLKHSRRIVKHLVQGERAE
jgi:hypothetical protein